MEQKEVAVRWAKKGADVQEGDTRSVPADRTTELIEDDAGTDTSGHAAPAVEDLVDDNDGTVPADRASTGETREAIREEHGVNGERCAKGYRDPPVPRPRRRGIAKSEQPQGPGGTECGGHDKDDARRVEDEREREEADHRRDRTIESGVQPGPRRTDPGVEAGRCGVRIQHLRKKKH